MHVIHEDISAMHATYMDCLHFMLGIPCSLDQTPRLLFLSSPKFVRHLIIARAAFIELEPHPQTTPTFSMYTVGVACGQD